MYSIHCVEGSGAERLQDQEPGPVDAWASLLVNSMEDLGHSYFGLFGAPGERSPLVARQTMAVKQWELSRRPVLLFRGLRWFVALL